MKTRKPLAKVAAAFLAATVMAGCSVNAPATAPNPVTAPQAAVQSPVFEVFVEDSDHQKAHAEFMAKLNLSEEQKTQLKGVIANAIDRSKPLRDELNPLITAPEIDRTALRTGIEVAMKADAAQDAQTMAEVRDILTAEQRQVMADTLNELATRQDDPHMKLIDKLMDKVSEKVTLTEAQKGSFDQLRTAVRDYWMTNRAAYMTAMATFMQQGNQDELRQTFEKLHESVPTDAMVDFMASLDQSQRQALVTWKEELIAKIKAKLTSSDSM